MRRLTPTDHDVVDAVFTGLSPVSRYLRFHTPTPRLTAAMRRALLAVDDRDRQAVVAEVDRRPVGLAHLVRTGEGEAEVAFAVVDDWHRRGIGRLLLDRIATLAVEAGHRRLHAAVLPGNGAALGLLRRTFPGATSVADEGVLRVLCPLGYDISDEDILAALAG